MYNEYIYTSLVCRFFAVNIYPVTAEPELHCSSLRSDRTKKENSIFTIRDTLVEF